MIRHRLKNGNMRKRERELRVFRDNTEFIKQENRMISVGLVLVVAILGFLFMAGGSSLGKDLAIGQYSSVSNNGHSNSVNSYNLGTGQVPNNNACVKGYFKDLWGWCVGWGTVTWTYDLGYSTLTHTDCFLMNGQTFVHTNSGGSWLGTGSWSGVSDTPAKCELHFTGTLSGGGDSMTIISKLFPAGDTAVNWYYYQIGGTQYHETFYVPISISGDV